MKSVFLVRTYDSLGGENVVERVFATENLAEAFSAMLSDLSCPEVIEIEIEFDMQKIQNMLT